MLLAVVFELLDVLLQVILLLLQVLLVVFVGLAQLLKLLVVRILVVKGKLFRLLLSLRDGGFMGGLGSARFRTFA